MCKNQNFRRDHNTVKDIESMGNLMRSNIYKTDPFSENKPEWALSSRYDLSGKYCFGAYDLKIGFLSEMKKDEIKFHFIAGPVKTDEVPQFQFNATEICKNVKHNLIPNEPKYDWIEYKKAISTIKNYYK